MVLGLRTKAVLAVLAVMGVTLTANFFSPVRLYYNATPSVPVGIYVLDTRHSPQLGMLAIARHHLPEWAKQQNIPVPESMTLLKYVRAVPGDRLEVRGNQIYRCDQALCSLIGERLADGYKGYRFPPLDLPAIVPPGQVYLGTDYPQGWDSRYLGLFDVSDLLGVASPLL